MSAEVTATPDQEIELQSLMQDENTGRAVRLVWIDSGLAFHNGWEKFRMATAQSDVMQVETVGIWMGENERVVMVAHSRDHENENWNVAMAVYKPCLIKKEWL